MHDFGEHGPEAVAYARSDVYDASTFTEVKPGYVFSDIDGDDSWLFAIFRVGFDNASSQPVTVDTGPAFTQLTNGTLNRRVYKLRIAANESTAGLFLAVGVRLSEWIKATQAPDRQNVITGTAQWSTEVEGETGILVRQGISIHGTLLESGPDNGAYTLRELGPDPMHNYSSRLVVEKKKRDYIVGYDEHGAPRMLPTIGWMTND